MLPSNSKTYNTLTVIGLTFGVTAQQVGKVLTQQGYREPKTRRPTGLAVEKNLVQCSYIATGQMFWLWKAKDVAEVMENAGWVKLPEKDIQANVIIGQIVTLLKKAAGTERWHFKRAWGLSVDFAAKSTSKHLQDLLSAIEKNAKSFYSEFENQYAQVILHKKLQEQIEESTKNKQFAPKSKM